MIEKNNKYILITAFLIVVGVAFYFFYWMRTPQYTFNQIRDAVQQHDLNKFEKHIDLNSIYSHAYNDLVYYSLGDPHEANPFLLSIIKSLQNAVVHTMVEQTREYVETGSLTNEKTSSNNNNTQQTNSLEPKNGSQELAEQFKERIGLVYMVYKGIESTENNDKATDIAVKIYDTQLEHDFILNIKMYELDDGTWRISEITNLKEFMAEREQAISEKLRQLNNK